MVKLMKTEALAIQCCDIRIDSRIIRELKLPDCYKFYKSVDFNRRSHVIPNYFFRHLIDMTKSIKHYYLDSCPTDISGYCPPKKERICIVISKFAGKDIFGFLWSIHPQEIIVPYVYPKTYRDHLEKPNAVPVIKTSAMIIDFALRDEFINWIPTIVILPKDYWKELKK